MSLELPIEAVGPTAGFHVAEDSEFEALYREHARFVWRMMRATGVPPGAAEDLLQEVFLRVLRRMHEYDGRAAWRTFLFNITRGVTANWRRAVAHERKGIAQLEAACSATADPERHLQIRRAGDVVAEFVAELDDAQQQLFFLVEIEGHTVAEAASVVGINVNTAYARVRGIRGALAHRLADHTAREEVGGP